LMSTRPAWGVAEVPRDAASGAFGMLGAGAVVAVGGCVVVVVAG